MRDLGQLGESTFAMWCAQVGLIANGSAIDKTGWDYYVEFPISQNISVNELHKSSFECKVQIKATDKQDRKLSITVSNLRRLATAQMPSFYIFLEFDRKNDVQNAFVVHLDNDLVSSILKRIHEIEQSDTNKNLHKKTMTLHYSEKHKLNKLDGESLQAILLKNIGHDYSEYIMNKSQFLKKCGFESGNGKVTFSIEGEEGFQQIIDLSLGLKDEIDVKNFVSVEQRFGIPSKSKSLELSKAKLSILNNNAKIGKIRFKDDNLSIGLVFDIKIYFSPFSFKDFRRFSKFRIVSDFFDMTCEPYESKVHYNFTLDDNKRFELKKFKDAITLIGLISRDKQKSIVELEIENLEPLTFSLTSRFVKRELGIFDELLEQAIQICLHLHIYEEISTSLAELNCYKQEIDLFYTLIRKTDKCDFRVEFEVNHRFKSE